jgi:hypothetical protein
MITRRIAWTLWSASIAFAAVGAALVLVSLDAPVPDNWGFRGFWFLVGPLFATVGLLVARRQSRNALGWILLVAGLTSSIDGFAQEYALRAVILTPGALPGGVAVAWLASWVWLFSSGPLMTFVPQLFPTGRSLTPRWRPLLLGGAGFIVFGFFMFGLRPGPAENAVFVDNPLPATGALAAARDALEVPLGALMALIVAVSGATLVVRFHRARGIEREQLKWAASSAALCAIAFAAMVVSGTSKASQVAMVGALMTIPVAMGIAILRYRLFDIDILINRALVYGATTAGIAAVFFGGIILFEAVLRPITSGSEVAVAISTLGVLALFQPLRRRVQQAVDRRFYRARYDAARTLDDFSARLRDEVDLDAVRSDLVSAVRDTVQPVHASLWLRSE